MESAAPDTEFPGWTNACYDDSTWAKPKVSDKRKTYVSYSCKELD